MNVQKAAALQAVAPGTVEDEAVVPANSSLEALRRIMGNVDLPIHRRIDAAETVITYELGPAALANADPDVPVAAASFKFLQITANAPETPETLRFRCLKALAAIENARASKSDTGGLAAHRMLVVQLINSARRAELIKAGTWREVAETGQEWSLRTSDEFDEPTLPAVQPGPRIEPDGRGVGAALHALSRCDNSQHAERTHQALLAVTAKNRVDDWRKLLSRTG